MRIRELITNDILTRSLSDYHKKCINNKNRFCTDSDWPFYIHLSSKTVCRWTTSCLNDNWTGALKTGRVYFMGWGGERSILSFSKIVARDLSHKTLAVTFAVKKLCPCNYTRLQKMTSINRGRSLY